MPANELNSYVAAKASLIAYAAAIKQNYKVAQHNSCIAEHLEAVERGEINRLLILTPPRHGKRIADSVPVITTKGWKTHGGLRVGDMVFSPNGNPVEVLAVHNRGECNRVITIDGERITCHENHEWKVYDREFGRSRILETKKLHEYRLTQGKIGKRGGRYVYQVKNISPLLFDHKELPLDPYFLGVWLGDGYEDDPRFCYHPNDDYPLTEILRRGFKITSITTHKDTGVKSAAFARQGIIETLGLIKVSMNKHIPELYLRSSFDQRLDLLAGLIDTDGHVERKTGRVRIATANKKLADSIVDLTTCLGFRPYVFEQQPTLSTSGIQGKKIVYYVGFQPDMDIPTKIPRKRIDVFAHRRKRPIENVDVAETNELGNCIEVSSDDGMYLVGRTLIPTHNSLHASELFPCWYLGRNPEKEIISVTYSNDKAGDSGRKVRDMITSADHRRIFPECQTVQDAASVHSISLTKGGNYYSVGVGGAIVGRGANCILLDDPLKGRKEADSPAVRRMLQEWYKGVIYTRLMKDNAIIIVLTRWHQDDLAGYVLQEQAHENWYVLSLPAIAEEDDILGRAPGEALWPDFKSVTDLQLIKESVGTREWNSQFQQRPVPAEGVMVELEWFGRYKINDPIDGVMWNVQSWDTAYKKEDDNAPSVCTTWKVTKSKMAYLYHVFRKKMEYPQLKKMVERQYDFFKPNLVLIEDKASGQSLVQEFRKTTMPVKGVQAIKDKVTRFETATGLIEAGKVFLPERAPWLVDYETELTFFPSGKYKDQVDSTSQFLDWLKKKIKLTTGRGNARRYYK